MVLIQDRRPFSLLFGCPHATASAFLPGGGGADWEQPEDIPLSDLTLVIKDSGATEPPLSLRVHKACLIRSEYFKVMLTSPLRESTQPVFEIEVPPHTRVAMLPVLAYLYDGVIDLDMENVKPAHSVAMWRLADFLQLRNFKSFLHIQMEGPDVFVAAVEQFSGDDGLIMRLLEDLLCASEDDMDQSAVAENMMEFLEHPGFLPALIHILPILPSASEVEDEYSPSRENVLDLLIGRHIDELADSALASLSLRDLSLALWSQLQRPPCITDNQTGEVVLRWLSLTPEALASEDVRGLVGLLDLRQMSPDFVAHRLLAHPRVLACLDPLALFTMHQMADMSCSLWQQIFCPITKRVMLPDVGSLWAPVKLFSCGHVVCAGFALEDHAAAPAEVKVRARVFKVRGGNCDGCKVHSRCGGTRLAAMVVRPEGMCGYLRAYFKRRQERFESHRAWVESLQARSEGTVRRASKKPRRGSSPTGPSSVTAPQTQDGVLIAVRRLSMEEDYRYFRVPQGLNAKQLSQHLLQLVKQYQGAPPPKVPRETAPSWCVYADLFIKDKVGHATSVVEGNAFSYQCLYRCLLPERVQEVELKEVDCLELTEIGIGG